MALMLPKVDVAFKLLFGDERSKNILADFLKAALPCLAAEEFEELTIVDSHLKREFAGDKLEILDVKVRTARGKSIDIDIQISAIPEMRYRVTYYLCNMITEQISMGGRQRVPHPLRGGVPASVFGLCPRPDKGGGGSDYRAICYYRDKGCTAAFELPYGTRDCSDIAGRGSALSCE